MGSAIQQPHRRNHCSNTSRPYPSLHSVSFLRGRGLRKRGSHDGKGEGGRRGGGEEERESVWVRKRKVCVCVCVCVCVRERESLPLVSVQNDIHMNQKCTEEFLSRSRCFRLSSEMGYGTGLWCGTLFACQLWGLLFYCLVNYNNNNINNNNRIERCNSKIFWQSPHCAVNRLQHRHSNGQDATVYKSHATRWTLVTCNMSWYEGTAQLLSLTEFKPHLC